MKNSIKILSGFVFLAVFEIIISITPANAKTKALNENKTYRYDLDGDGKKEKISYEIEKTDGDSYYYSKAVNFYINGKKFAVDASIKNSWYSESGWASVNLIDVNTADKYKELEIYLDGEEWPVGCIVLRYKSGKLKTYFTTGGTKVLGLADNQTKGNTVIGEVEVYSALGQTRVYCKYRIKDQKLEEIMPQYCTLEVMKNWQKHWFEAGREIMVYKKPNGEKVVKTLKKGNKFRISEIRMINGKPAYARISIKGSKNIGWVNIGDTGNNGSLVVNIVSYA